MNHYDCLLYSFLINAHRNNLRKQSIRVNMACKDEVQAQAIINSTDTMSSNSKVLFNHCLCHLSCDTVSLDGTVYPIRLLRQEYCNNSCYI